MSRVRAATSVVVLCLALAACPSSRGAGGGGAGDTTPKEPADRAVRIAVARAEAKREDGVRELEELLRTADKPTKLLALRGMGRVGGRQARATLTSTLEDPDVEISAGALAALGVARELEDTSLEDLVASSAAIEAAFARTTGPTRLLAIEALGRTGSPPAQRLLTAQLTLSAEAAEAAEAAGVALARFGRRKIAFTSQTITALITASSASDPRIRYGAVYALARAFVEKPPAKPDPALARALGERIEDPDADVRAQTFAAIGKYDAIEGNERAFEHALLDRDWRVAVEAVRVMTSDANDGSFAEAVAVGIVRRLLALDNGEDPEAHVIMEGLRGLQKSGARTIVHDALKSIVSWSKTTRAPALTRAWIGCLATSALVRGDNAGLATAQACSDRALPDHLRLPLVADLVTANTGTIGERRTALAMLLAHEDVRVRAAGLGALIAPWKEGAAGDHTSAIGILVGALASKEPILAGSAIDAAAGFYDAIGAGDHAAIDAAVIARATTEQDAELSGSLLELIGKQKLAAGADACRAGLTGIPVRAKAARGCLRALGEPANDPPAPTHAAAPPVDVGNVIGANLEWHLETTRGEIVIALAPQVAPWAVASIVALTTSGKYDGLEFHRVVPDFVVQGGDPTESGWGGPGYALPAEPSTTADGNGFVVGGVGMADAGKDSAGSQWFIMHARAAHLDGRYTWVGAVQSGQKSADALLIGDKVVKATITAKSATRR